MIHRLIRLLLGHPCPHGEMTEQQPRCPALPAPALDVSVAVAAARWSQTVISRDGAAATSAGISKRVSRNGATTCSTIVS
jgi:hypothetical protein